MNYGSIYIKLKKQVKWEQAKISLWWWLHNYVNILNTTEL